MIIPKTVQKECVTGVSSEILKDVGLKSVAAPSNFVNNPNFIYFLHLLKEPPSTSQKIPHRQPYNQPF